MTTRCSLPTQVAVRIPARETAGRNAMLSPGRLSAVTPSTSTTQLGTTLERAPARPTASTPPVRPATGSAPSGRRLSVAFQRNPRAPIARVFLLVRPAWRTKTNGRPRSRVPPVGSIEGALLLLD